MPIVWEREHIGYLGRGGVNQPAVDLLLHGEVEYLVLSSAGLLLAYTSYGVPCFHRDTHGVIKHATKCDIRLPGVSQNSLRFRARKQEYYILID